MYNPHQSHGILLIAQQVRPRLTVPICAGVCTTSVPQRPAPLESGAEVVPDAMACLNPVVCQYCYLVRVEDRSGCLFHEVLHVFKVQCLF